MAARSTKGATPAVITKELGKLVDPELLPAVERWAGAFAADVDFRRGFEMYQRVSAAGRARPEGAEWFAELRRDAKLFFTAHLLRREGGRLVDIAAQLNEPRVLSWLGVNDVPYEFFQRDPLRWVKFVKQVNIPAGESPDFAYVLGAYAGTRRVGAETPRIGFWNADRKVVERVIDAAAKSCGLVMNCKLRNQGPGERFLAFSAVGQFAGALFDLTAGNSKLAWEHLQTGAERREFLRGFFDFSGGTIHSEFRRFVIGRRNNPGMLEEVALVLKHEGILARISDGTIPGLNIDSCRDLALLAEKQLVSTRRLAAPLAEALANPTGMFAARPEEYAAVMTLARRMPGYPKISPFDLVERLKREGIAPEGLSVDSVRDWVIEGRVPMSVQRLKALDDIERRVFSSERRRNIGEQLFARLGEDLHPTRVTRALSDFFGGDAALSKASGVPEREVTAITKSARLPSRAEYRLLLSTLELPLTRELEQGLLPPSGEIIESWFPGSRDREAFRSYQGALILAARNAFERGEDPKKAVRERLNRILKRNSSMLTDD